MTKKEKKKRTHNAFLGVHFVFDFKKLL
jgi:hypothetical protein